MKKIDKKPSEAFLVTVDFDNRLVASETIDSFSVVCVDTDNNTLSPALLFFEDTVYGEVDSDYGDGRYGGIPDNLKSSITYGIQDGSLNGLYKITVKIVTNLGDKYEEDLFFTPLENQDGKLEKQPYENVSFVLDYTSILFKDDIRYDDTISSQTTTIIDTLDNTDVTSDMFVANSIESDTTVKIKIKSSDTLDGNFMIMNKITTTQEYKYQMNIIVIVEER